MLTLGHPEPGGYLQWQEMDAIDCWATPATPRARSTISYTVREREARGLTNAYYLPTYLPFFSYALFNVTNQSP